MDLKKHNHTFFQNSARSKLGQITQTGTIHNSLGVKPMRIYGRYALVYLLEGSGNYVDAHGLESPVTAGDLILVFPTLGHGYGPGKGEHWSEIYFVFEGPIFNLWETQGLLDPKKPVHRAEPIPYWLNRLQKIVEKPGRPKSPDTSLIEVNHFLLVLSEMLENGSQKKSPHKEWLNQACKLLESDFSRELDLNDLATKLGVSYENFRKLFVKAFGVSPARYRTTRIIDRACEFMQIQQLTDKQIAEKLGFCDEFHFSKRFKSITGFSPRQFRQHQPQMKIRPNH